MVFRISEIEEKRAKVPAQYRANPADALTDTFDDERADAPTEQERRNAALRTLSEADGAEREMDRAGVLAGRAREGMYNNAATEQAQKRAEKARKERAETAIYLAMLQQQINDLNKQIELYGHQIDATDKLIALIDDGETLDPNNPHHKKLMDAAGIPDDKRDGLTRQDIIDHKKALQAKIDNAKVDLDKKTDDLDAALRENRANGGSVARNGSKTELDDKYIEKREAASRIENLEQKKMALEDFAQYKGSPEYTVKIDEFIAGADEMTLAKLMKSPDTPKDIIARIGIQEFKTQISFLDEFKGTPDYQMYVQMAVDDAPENIREALRNEPNLSEELTTALYEPYTDELEAEKQTAETANADPITVSAPETTTTEQGRDPAAKPLGLG